MPECGRLERVRFLQRLPLGAALIGPPAALGALAFDAGGYYPGSTAIATVAAFALLALWVVLARRPLASLTPGAAVVVALLGAYAGWVLLSDGWSHANARAMVEFDRALLYLVTFVLFALVGRSAARVRVLVGLLGAAAAVVAVVGLAAWLLPHQFPISHSFERRRMSWPTGYWNTTGLLAGFGAIWCLHLASSARENPLFRVAGAAAVVPLVAVLGFTASRGAILATGVGAVVYVLATRSRGTLVGMVACAPAALGAAFVVHSTQGVANTLLPPSSITLGHRGARELGLVTAVVAAIRVVLLLADTGLARVPVPRPRARTRVVAAAGGLVVVVAVAFALGAGDRVTSAYQEFTQDSRVGSVDNGSRLRSFSSDGRTDIWRVALDYGFAPDRLRGSGAGTFAVLWDAHRPAAGDVLVAHSLYIETLAELGLVGAVLLFAALALIVCALIARLWAGDPAERAAWAALLAGTAGWLVFASVDWNWQMPACTVWLFAAGGLAFGRPALAGLVEAPGGVLDASSRPQPVPSKLPSVASLALRLVAAGVLLAVILFPLAVARSDRHLDRALSALQAGDCPTAQRQARLSHDALGRRPEPEMVLAYCAARDRRGAPAAAAAARAVHDDPEDWETHYAQGLVAAAGGRSPRAELLAARRLNPLDRYVTGASRPAAVARSRTARARVARRLPLPLAVRHCGGPNRAGDLASCGNSVLPTLGAGPPKVTSRP